MDTLGVPFHYGAVDTFSVGGWQFPFSAGQQYSVTIPYNSPKPTKVWGFEFEHQANFNFLPGLFKNFVFSYNVSILRSETYLMSSGLDTTWIVIRGVRFPQYTSTIIETKQKLEGQPELYGNAALGYDIGGFSARVSVFFQGKFNNTFSATQLADQVNDGLTRWDLALKQQVTDNIAVMLNVNNLTNMYETTTTANRIQGWNLPDTGQFYGLTADLGVRITL
jgi:outer membrane receptor protein involved in Fe transport